MNRNRLDWRKVEWERMLAQSFAPAEWYERDDEREHVNDDGRQPKQRCEQRVNRVKCWQRQR